MRQLGKTGRRWKDNIKINLKEVRWGHGLDLSASGKGEVMSCFECCDEPSVFS